MEALLLVPGGALCWFLSTLAGGGGASLALPLVAFFVGARSVAPTVTVATLVVNPARSWMFREHLRWDVLRWYVPGAILGAVGGAYTFVQLNPRVLATVLGVFLVTTPLQYGFVKRKRTFRMPMPAFLPVGVFVAYVSGLVGAGGPLVNPFYLNVQALKEEMVGTKSLASVVVHVTKLVMYGGLGVLAGRELLLGLGLGAGAAIGSWAAKPWLQRMPELLFRRVVLVAMTLAGVLLILGR